MYYLFWLFFFYTFLSTEKKGKNIQHYKTITARSTSICQILLYGRRALTRFVLKQGRKSPKKGQSSAPPPPNHQLFDLCIIILKVLKCFFTSYMKHPCFMWTILQQQIRPCQCYPSLQRSPKGKWVQTAVTDMIFFPST